MFSITGTPLNRENLVSSLKNDKAGAIVVFEGWVRDHNEGKKVSSLEYQVYEALAIKEGEKILAEARHKFNLHDIICSHRFGHLYLGDIAVWIGAIASHRDDAFKATRFVIDEIKLRLPVWKKEHYVDQEAEWVFCKHHHTHVHFHEHDYYQKQEKVINQQSLKAANVLVAGAGGLGCPALIALTTAGVGHIDVVDFDKISISNIHRQPLYSPDVVGEKKVTVAVNKLTLLNPFIHVHGHDFRIDHENVEKLIKGKSIVLDCTDNLETKFLLHDACFRMKIPLISASVYKSEGQIRTFIPGSDAGCLRCSYDVTPDDSKLGNCNDFGVLGSTVYTIGSMQASEAMLLLETGNNNTHSSTFYTNLKTLSQFKIKNNKKENCECCKGNVELEKNDFEIDVQTLGTLNAVTVDVREQDDQCLNNYKTEKRPVVVICHRGIRSKKLVKVLRQEGHHQFYSLKGGAQVL